MLDKTLKVTGILACIAIILIGAGISYDLVCRIIRDYTFSASNQNITPGMIRHPANQAFKSIQMNVIKTHQNKETVILLISVENTSQQTIPLHGLRINITDKAGEIIDKCSQGRNIMDDFVNAKQKKTVKVICTQMVFLQQYSGEVNYKLSFSRYGL